MVYIYFLTLNPFAYLLYHLGKGLTPEVYNGLTWKSNVAMGGVGLDGAISSSGLAIVTTPFAIMISHDNGQTFNSTSNIYGPSQDVHILDNDVIAAVGAFSIGSSKEKVSGVIVSSDSGATWTGYNAGEYARYGAFPTATTWYVTSGIWSETVSTKNSQTYSLTKRRNVAVENVASDLDDDYSATGWFGKIFKTTDAGSTWYDISYSLFLLTRTYIHTHSGRRFSLHYQRIPITSMQFHVFQRIIVLLLQRVKIQMEMILYMHLPLLTAVKHGLTFYMLSN